VTAPLDVLAVMDRMVELRAGLLPDGRGDLCGKVRHDPTNPHTARAKKSHADAVEARRAVAELVEAAQKLLDNAGEVHPQDSALYASRVAVGRALAKFGGRA
jgi:hypothetical protein